MANALLGSLEAFSVESENWEHYFERVDQYFLANGIDDGNKKKAILLTVIGAESYFFFIYAYDLQHSQ